MTSEDVFNSIYNHLWMITVLLVKKQMASIVKIASGVSGLYPRVLCGRILLYSLLHCSINTIASVKSEGDKGT